MIAERTKVETLLTPFDRSLLRASLHAGLGVTKIGSRLTVPSQPRLLNARDRQHDTQDHRAHDDAHEQDHDRFE